MRVRARVDRNHVEIVKALRKLGASVQSLASIGQGCPDLLIAYDHRLYLAEVKDGSRFPSERRLTEDEVEWHQNWKSQVHILESIEDALRMIGAKT